MKKNILKSRITLLIIFIIFSLFLFSNVSIRASSISDNTSRGITLQSTSRVKQIDCIRATEFGLPGTRPAVLAEHGIGSILEFTDATQDISLAEFRVSLGIDTSAQPMLQLQWACDTPDPTGDVVNVRWQITYAWFGEDATTDIAADATSDAVYNVSSTAKGLVESDIQLSGMASTDKRLRAKITRIADGTDDTANGVNADLFDACLYFIINKLGESL